MTKILPRLKRDQVAHDIAVAARRQCIREAGKARVFTADPAAASRAQHFEQQAREWDAKAFLALHGPTDRELLALYNRLPVAERPVICREWWDDLNGGLWWGVVKSQRFAFYNEVAAAINAATMTAELHDEAGLRAADIEVDRIREAALAAAKASDEAA